MKGTKYLSELVDCSALQKGQLNVIKAPTGSGKTYFALNYIPSLTNDALHNVVYLIDTINGKEQIVRNYNATSEYYGWSKEVESGGMWFEPDNRVVVITYAKFGVLFERNIEFYKNFSYIICDEIHRVPFFIPPCGQCCILAISNASLHNFLTAATNDDKPWAF